MRLAKMSRERVLSLLVLLLSGVAPISGQVRTGSVTGTVTCSDGNFPARGASVKLIPVDPNGSSSDSRAQDSQSTKTDFSGEFQFSTVNPGEYVLDATLQGYRDEQRSSTILSTDTKDKDKGHDHAALSHVNVKPGITAQRDLILRRAASISGQISVDLGGVLIGMPVIAEKIQNEFDSTQVGKPKFSESTMTDDRGDYRISGLEPGKYMISILVREAFFGVASLDSGTLSPVPQRPGTADLEVFAPGVLEQSSAKVIDVGDADDLSGENISIPVSKLHSISGTIFRDGQPVGGVAVSVRHEGGTSPLHGAISMPNGSYRFDLLPEGSYVITSTIPNLPGSTVPQNESMNVRITGSDILDANIDLRTFK